MVAGVLVLPGDDLLHPLNLDEPQCRRELAHPEVEAVDPVLELAVVAVRAGELDQVRVGRDEHPALAGRDRLRRVERVDAGVAIGAGTQAVPPSAVGVGAVLEQEDVVGRAVLGDPLAVECDVAADVDEDRGAGLQPVGRALEVVEGHAEVLAIAVDELDLGPRPEGRQRCRHEGVRRAENGLAADAGELERRQRPSCPAREPEALQPVPLSPASLEGVELLALRPLLGVEHLGPEIEETATIAVVEPDCEPGGVRPGVVHGYD